MKSAIKSCSISITILIFMGLNTAPSPAAASDKDSFYHIELSKDVLTKPEVMAAWRAYGKFKGQWRDSIFFQMYPNETEYRYTYKEELDCRRKLAEYWIAFKKANPGTKDRYLDDLAKAYRSVYFPEYVYKLSLIHI